MAPQVGLEPTTDRLTADSSTTELLWINKMERVMGIEPTTSAWKAEVLPLNYTRLITIMGRLMGIEPTSVGTTIRCVNHFATTAMAGTVGIEPTSKVLETSILPLNYVPIFLMVEGGRFELPNPKERIYSPPRLATSLPLRGGE